MPRLIWWVSSRIGTQESRTAKSGLTAPTDAVSRASNRNPLDDVPRHPLLPPVVKPGRPRLRMPGQVLHILQRPALAQQIGDRRHAEAVRRQPRRQPGIPEPPLDQGANL